MNKNKLWPLYTSQILRSVAVSLLSFFSAIFIFKETASLMLVFLFFLALYLAKLLSTCWAENLALKLGLKSQVVLGHLLTVLSLLAFAATKWHLNFLWLASVLWGLAIGFFWFGRHGLIAKISQPGHYGRAIGNVNAISLIVAMFVPLLGGFLISRWGYSALFLTALVFALAAIFSIRSLPEKKTHQDASLKEIGRLFLSHRRTALVHLSLGAIGSFYATALVLYIFSVLKAELGLGGFFSLSLLLVALAHLITGRLIDKKGKKSLLVYGSLFSCLAWLGRFSVTAAPGLLFFDVLDRIALGMVGMPMTVISFEKAINGHSTGRALLFRETSITLGSILACLSLMALTFIGLPLKGIFLLAALFSLSPLLIVNKDGLI